MTATIRGWTACTLPIVLWLVHLTALSTLVEPTCDRTGLIWVPHALTVGLALGCVPFLVVAARLTRPPAGSVDDETEAPGDLRFLGWLAVGLGGASVLLILAEGLVALGVDPCR